MWSFWKPFSRTFLDPKSWIRLNLSFYLHVSKKIQWDESGKENWEKIWSIPLKEYSWRIAERYEREILSSCTSRILKPLAKLGTCFISEIDSSTIFTMWNWIEEWTNWRIKAQRKKNFEVFVDYKELRCLSTLYEVGGQVSTKVK